ncbi:hypothetical protein ABT126_10965 [Streptomyces sp. NPDC002012]|uniref:hypothetical protein n=1 Tax=Streptomyces sp. NPDC002012 TaxID=3154532 RepID=UPI003326FA58
MTDGDEIRLGNALLLVTVTDAKPATVPDARPEPADAPHTLLAAAEAGETDLTEIRGYQLLQELGRGGQGVVHLARREKTGELLALKTLLAHGSVSRAVREGFLREFACTRALRHRNWSPSTVAACTAARSTSPASSAVGAVSPTGSSGPAAD